MFWTASLFFFFFFICHVLADVVRVMEGKKYVENEWRETKIVRVSGRFDLLRVRVAEGKSTVNV